jgi:N-acetylglucosaminyl-diphospho-decaprenol L-rhamnosyltransferase
VGSVSVVIVTYNSGVFVSNLMSALEGQTKLPDSVVVVDSGSTDTSYLERVRMSPLHCTLIMKPNVGVCVGNNIGWSHSRDYDYVLYLNPDAFLAPDFLEIAVRYMDDPANGRVGMVSGTLLGYDIEKDGPTGLIDTTGVEQTWYAQFPERDQGKPMSALSKYTAPNKIAAICSAVVLCRQEMLFSIAEGENIFDPVFFMYKDDTDLSLRARRAGWLLMHHPQLTAYHCRGWKKRAAVPQKMRELSAKNEIRMLYKHRSPYVVFSLLKYVLVRAFNL